MRTIKPLRVDQKKSGKWEEDISIITRSWSRLLEYEDGTLGTLQKIEGGSYCFGSLTNSYYHDNEEDAENALYVYSITSPIKIFRPTYKEFDTFKKYNTYLKEERAKKR